ncbi:hypothetical protein Hanom_Chr14g01275601 [Helianthus anomalus]
MKLSINKDLGPLCLCFISPIAKLQCGACYNYLYIDKRIAHNITFRHESLKLKVYTSTLLNIYTIYKRHKTEQNIDDPSVYGTQLRRFHGIEN